MAPSTSVSVLAGKEELHNNPEPKPDIRAETYPQLQIESLSGINLTAALFVGGTASSTATGLLLSSLSWLWLITFVVTLGVALATFIVYRHFEVIGRRQRPSGGSWLVASNAPQTSAVDAQVPDTTSLPAVYVTYILGSGGHTAEMMETIKQSFRGQANMHRRYIISTGDTSSLAKARLLESTIKGAYPGEDARAGTSDIFLIRRARKVHQPLYTAPFTCLISALHAAHALTRMPNLRSTKGNAKDFKYPHLIVTNGPANGYIVSLVAHLLKIFYLVPENRAKMVYIETWARSKTMSLTGKLFLKTGIADVVGVQHESLARIFKGSQYIGPVSAGFLRK
ncbi:oligosaccharide biosynthesis protein Alg14 like-domain-containing protein [Pseudoneurospora amorphoporcata]|uniref:UDP-N-acetylglucosamine transferase subunit ALG14 n=1 Tax=Pseudoneurospora amorphoporcata TaxID=241081 RepID=A0AAN6NNT9_9PEZI|nr:oligosaccharide biosynthesis protein Alg14 like-domain-containing protein [Pseudoneurospora amorphoporcata]